ncbi:MAG: hypothetical protein IJL87_07410 [Clostridia bacterium]|nr:hypothetical protein [Clostridia bacterium]
MKRFTAIFLAAVLSLTLLCSCKANKTQTDSEPAATAAYSIEKVDGIKLDKGDGNKIDVVYPQIAGWALADKQDKWNEEFASFNIGETSELEGGATIDTVEYYEVTYEVATQTDDILSIVFYGSIYYVGAAHPFAYASAHTIDMKTGDEITLAGLPEDKRREIAKAAGEGKFEIISGGPISTVEELIPELEIYYGIDGSQSVEDAVYEEISNAEYSSGNYFIKDGKTCVILPIHHAAGDYVIAQFDF